MSKIEVSKNRVVLTIFEYTELLNAPANAQDVFDKAIIAKDKQIDRIQKKLTESRELMKQYIKDSKKIEPTPKTVSKPKKRLTPLSEVVIAPPKRKSFFPKFKLPFQLTLKRSS